MDVHINGEGGKHLIVFFLHWWDKRLLSPLSKLPMPGVERK